MGLATSWLTPEYFKVYWDDFIKNHDGQHGGYSQFFYVLLGIFSDSNSLLKIHSESLSMDLPKTVSSFVLTLIPLSLSGRKGSWGGCQVRCVYKRVLK